VLELDLSAVKFLFFPRYNIKYIRTIYTRLDTCLMSISRFSLRNQVTLRLLKLYSYIADVVEWSRALDILVLQCINGVRNSSLYKMIILQKSALKLEEKF
jgi:hypothetical protein